MRKETENHRFKPFTDAIAGAIAEAIDEAATAFSHVEAAAQAAGSEEQATGRRCGHRARRHRSQSSTEEREMHGGGHGFGARRPLRLLARRLNLSDEQAIEMSSILDEMRHARAQVALDTQRTAGGFADVLLQSELDGEQVRQLAAERVKSREKMAAATVRCLERTHALLDEEQRKNLAMLMRSGALTL